MHNILIKVINNNALNVILIEVLIFKQIVKSPNSQSQRTILKLSVNHPSINTFNFACSDFEVRLIRAISFWLQLLRHNTANHCLSIRGLPIIFDIYKYCNYKPY